MKAIRWKLDDDWITVPDGIGNNSQRDVMFHKVPHKGIFSQGIVGLPEDMKRAALIIQGMYQLR